MTHTSPGQHLRLVGAAPHPLDDLCAALAEWTARSDDGRPVAYLEVGDGVLHHKDYPLTAAAAAELAAMLRASTARDPGRRPGPGLDTAQHGSDPVSTCRSGRPAAGQDRADE